MYNVAVIWDPVAIFNFCQYLHGKYFIVDILDAHVAM